MATSVYAVTRYPTPIFNTPRLTLCFGGHDGNSLALDKKGLLRNVETILFPQSKIELLEQIDDTPVWKIRTAEYPYEGPLYIDDRFIQLCTSAPPDRQIKIPTVSTLIKKLKALKYSPYIWGGNWPMGIDLLSQLYPSQIPFSQLDRATQEKWCLKGLDCSGLPYYLTNGYTPRNTSSLIHFGIPVPIEGDSAEKIFKRVRALDFIVWKGHVVWIVNQEEAIESRYPQGLVRSKLILRLTEIMKERTPLNTWKDGRNFVIRRWHPHQLNLD